MRITMIGSGYVGLVSGACFADFGHAVTCVDKDAGKIDALLAGRMPIYEPGLEQLVATNVAAGRLAFTTDLAAGVAGADAVFIAVGTPSRRGDGHADLSYVYDATKEVAAAATGALVVVTKSTVPVGTGDRVEAILRETNSACDFAVVSNPEFLREGAAIGDFKRPDRIVIGTDDARARAVMQEVYRPLYLGESPILFTGRRTAELTKYAANAFLATKITFINEIADLCEAVGADVQDVARGIGLDNRIGRKFLHAGPGYGGSCFPKDTLALLKTAEDFEAPVRIVEAVVKANDARKRAMGRKVIAALGEGEVRGKTVAVLGLTFKPNTDDMRDAPSIAIVQALTDAGVEVRAFDPEGTAMAKTLMPDITYCADPYAAATGADAIAIVTEWDVFRALDLTRLAGLMRAPVLVDLRNVYNRAEAERAGFAYSAIGRWTRPRIAGLLETALYVDDTARSVRFFREMLGLTTMLESERLTAFDAGHGGVLLVFARGQSRDDAATPGVTIPGHDGTGPLHMAFAISPADYEPWRERLRDAKVAITSEVTWPRGGRSLHFADPDGNVIELATPGLWANDADRSA